MLHLTAAIFTPFELPFMARALVVMLLLSVPAGLVGTWVVLRNMAFYTHSVGPATFPALVIAQAGALNSQLLAAVAAVLYALAFRLLSTRRASADATTAFVLIGSLALGAILASDAFNSPAQVDSLLFGSLLAVGSTQVVVCIVGAALTVVLSAYCWRRWKRDAFDGGKPNSVATTILLLLIALTAVMAVTTVGALLVSALFVMPAATARLWSRTTVELAATAFLVAAIESVVSLIAAYWTNVPPGASFALLSGGIFFVTLLAVQARQLVWGRALATGESR